MEDQESKKVNEELTQEQRLEIEQKAIDALINMGVRFSVPLRIQPRKAPKRLIWWNKHFPNRAKAWNDPQIPKDWNVTLEDLPDADLGTTRKTYVRHFHVKPLYLGTIDAVRRLYLQIEFDEGNIEKEPIQETKRLFKYIPVMAEIAAIAIINNPEVANPLSKEVKDLKEFLIAHLTVHRLAKLAAMISTMMNPGGFTNSIRSILEIGTTKPKADLVEE